MPAEQTSISRVIYIAYNIIWWLPLILTLIGIIDYRTGFITFFVISMIRAAANLYRSNVLDVAQAQVFPLRAP